MNDDSSSPLNQPAGPPTPGSPPDPPPAVEESGSVTGDTPPGRQPPKRRSRKPKIMQFSHQGELVGEPESVVLETPEPDAEPGGARGSRSRRSKKFTGDQAVKLLQVPFHGMAQFTGAQMWEVETQECEWFKDELADVLTELSKQSGGKLGHYFPYIVAGSGVALLSVTRAYGYYRLSSMLKQMQTARSPSVGQPVSHPPRTESEPESSNGFTPEQEETLLRAAMSMMGS